MAADMDGAHNVCKVQCGRICTCKMDFIHLNNSLQPLDQAAAACRLHSRELHSVTQMQ